jgi:type IV pilus assembly protein PilC
MPKFSYIARDRNGQQVSDAIESVSRERAAVMLRTQGLLPIKITQLKSDTDFTQQYSLNPFDYESLNDRDIEFAFQQIAVMLASGIALLDAVNLTITTSRIGARKVWVQVGKRIQQGASFYDALSEHSQFTEFTLQLIRIGEQSGNLSLVMQQASNQIKTSRKLKKDIVVAIRYPFFSMLMAIGVCALMLVKLVPEMKKMLKIFGKPLPDITKALIDVSDWVLAHGLMIVIGISVVSVSFYALYMIPKSRWWIDFLALRLPLFGLVFRMSGTLLFSRALSLLLKSGVVIVDALETIEKLHKNKYLASRVAYARQQVILGHSLSETMQSSFGYMPVMLHVLSVGESSGRMEVILEDMTEYFEEQLQHRIAALTGLISPTMTIFVGGLIGFVYAAYMVGMFAATGATPR